jgi:hypothetical protein
MMKPIRLLALFALGCAMIVSASAQGAASAAYATKKAYCDDISSAPKRQHRGFRVSNLAQAPPSEHH